MNSSPSPAPDMPRIVVVKQVTPVDTEGSFKLRVWIRETTHGIPADLMVYQHIPPVPSMDYPQDQWVHIASYADLAMYPVDAPDCYTPFFRKYYFDLTFPVRPALEACWSLCRQHLQLTVEDYTRINGLPPAEFVVEEM